MTSPVVEPRLEFRFLGSCFSALFLLSRNIKISKLKEVEARGVMSELDIDHD